MTEYSERMPSPIGASSILAPVTASGPLLRGLMGNVAAHWPVWLAFALAFAAAGFGLATGLFRLGERWANAFAYSHGYLVAAMTAWLMFKVLRTHPPARLAPSALGLCLLVAATLVYALFEVLDFTLGLQATLPLLLVGLVATLAGIGAARVVLFPAGLLYFAIPFWDLAVPALRDVATSVVTAWLSMTNVTAYIDGYYVSVAAGTFEIAEGCSGQRYFVVGLALAAFYGLSWYRRWSTRLILFAVAAFMAMASNWVRIFALILVGDATDMEHYLIAESHDGFGWVVFAVLMFPVLLFARWLEQREESAVTGRMLSHSTQRASAATFIALGALSALVLASPGLLRQGVEVVETAAPIDLSAAQANGWYSVDPSTEWAPEYHHPHELAHTGFLNADGLPLDVYLARYLRQQPQAKLIGQNNSFDEGWRRAAARSVSADIGAVQRQVQELELTSARDRRLVWHWFHVGGMPTHDRTHAKLLEIPALLRGRRDGAVVAVSASCASNCDAARSAMSAFLQSAGPALEAAANGDR